MSNEEFFKKHRLEISTVLGILTILMFIGLFLPWSHVEIIYEGGKFNVSQTVTVDGWGRTTVKNVTEYFFNTSRQAPSFTKEGTLPAQRPFLVPSFVSILILLFMVVRNLFVEKFDDFFRKVFGEDDGLFSKDFLKFSGKNLYIPFFIGVVNVFTTSLYFLIYFQQSLMPLSDISLTNFILEGIRYGNYIRKEVGAAKYSRSVILGPGVGPFLVFFSGVGLIYLYFLYFLFKRGWPNLWKKRMFLVPLLVLSTFLPWGKVIREESGRVFLGCTIPIFGIPGGGVTFLVLSIVFLVLLFYNAITDKEINDITSEIYHRDNIQAHELKEFREQLDEDFFRIKILRMVIFVVLFFVMISAFFQLYWLMELYQVSTEQASIHFVSDGLGGWMAFLGPLAEFTVLSIFRH